MTASGELPQALLASLIPFTIGLVISIIGGVALGIVLGQFWLLEYILDPFLNALYVIPRVALIPLIILWAGLEVTGKVVIVTLIAIFPVIVNTYSGIKDVRGSLMEIGKAYGATETQIFTKIILPAAVPYIMAGIRLAVGTRHHRHHRRGILHRDHGPRRRHRCLRQQLRDGQAVRADHRDRRAGNHAVTDRRRHRAQPVALANFRARQILT